MFLPFRVVYATKKFPNTVQQYPKGMYYGPQVRAEV